MTIVAKAETRNSQWANDTSSFGRKMLAKMGWKGDGSGLGKEQQGSSVHLRAVRRVESLGIGAENDTFGDRGWRDTNAGFHGVLASLRREYGDGDDGGGDAGGSKEKRRRDKEERKRAKKEGERAAKKRKRGTGDDDQGSDDGESSEAGRRRRGRDEKKRVRSSEAGAEGDGQPKDERKKRRKKDKSKK